MICGRRGGGTKHGLNEMGASPSAVLRSRAAKPKNEKHLNPGHADI